MRLTSTTEALRSAFGHRRSWRDALVDRERIVAECPAVSLSRTSDLSLAVLRRSRGITVPSPLKLAWIRLGVLG